MYTEFPCLKIFPLHNFQKRDCPCILAHTFGIGLLLLMIIRDKFLAVPGGIIVMLNLSAKESTDNDLLKRFILIMFMKVKRITFFMNINV